MSELYTARLGRLKKIRLHARVDVPDSIKKRLRKDSGGEIRILLEKDVRDINGPGERGGRRAGFEIGDFEDRMHLVRPAKRFSRRLESEDGVLIGRELYRSKLLARSPFRTTRAKEAAVSDAEPEKPSWSDVEDKS